MTIFWQQALLAVRPFADGPPPYPAWPWLAASIAAACLPLLLPAAYYLPRRIERSGRLYRAMGVTMLRRVVTNGDLVNQAVRRRFPGYCLSPAAQRLDEALRNGVAAERSHLVMAMLGFGAFAYALRCGWPGWAAWLLLSNIVGNVWPILLQRYTRARIARLGARVRRPGRSSDP